MAGKKWYLCFMVSCTVVVTIVMIGYFSFGMERSEQRDGLMDTLLESHGVHICRGYGHT